eukprot:g15807.t1
MCRYSLHRNPGDNKQQAVGNSPTPCSAGLNTLPSVDTLPLITTSTGGSIETEVTHGTKHGQRFPHTPYGPTLIRL